MDRSRASLARALVSVVALACTAWSQNVSVFPGDDWWTTPAPGLASSSTIHLILPQDWFGSGSDPLNQTVGLTGVPLLVDPPGVLGPTDTIVRRMAFAGSLSPGESDTIPALIKALRLTAAVPLQVTYSGVAPELWALDLTLSQLVPQSNGTMLITHDTLNGGHYDLTLPVVPRLQFTRQSDGKLLVRDPAPSMSMVTVAAPWIVTDGPTGFDRDAAGIVSAPFGTPMVFDSDGDGILDENGIGNSNFQGGVADLAVGLFECHMVSQNHLVLSQVFRPAIVPQWINLGDGLSGTAGTPSLSGDGCFCVGGTISMELTSALPNAPMFMVIGSQSINAPFKGGVLVPAVTAPNGLFVPLATDAAGHYAIVDVALPGTPIGFRFFVQCWIPDPGGPLGWSASNAVESPVP